MLGLDTWGTRGASINPEVFADGASQGGFDALVGNPPFLGGNKITGPLGTDYRNYLVNHISGGRRGHADLCVYFLLRAHQLVRTHGNLGMLATDTVAQGDTREVGLDYMVMSLAVFAVAFLISLGKSGTLPRWRTTPRGEPPPTAD